MFHNLVLFYNSAASVVEPKYRGSWIEVPFEFESYF